MRAAALLLVVVLSLVSRLTAAQPGGELLRVNDEREDAIDDIEVYRAASGQRLRGERIYSALGRPDLAQRYRRAAGGRWGMFGATIGLLGIGLGVGVGATLALLPADTSNRPMLTAVTGGVALLMLPGALLTGLLWQPHPIDGRTLQQLVRDNNARVPLSVVPVLSATGAGVAVALAF